MPKNAKLREKQKWAIENQRGIYFIDPEDMESKEIIKNARRKLKTPMAPAMPCLTCKKNKHGETRTRQMISSCILEASESIGTREEESLPNHHEDHNAGKADNSPQHYNMVHKFIPMPQAMKTPQQKQQWIKNGRNLKRFQRGTKQVRNKSDVIDEARKGGKVHFASLMDLCHLKNADLETKHQKYEGRVVLRGDIVKDDSGSYAVFTEQGSSASQMTAAMVMDIISRLPECAGQAADAISAETQVKMEDASKIKEKSKIGMSRHIDSSTTTNGQNHGPVWKTQSFLLNEICTVILWQDCCGKGNLRKSY